MTAVPAWPPKSLPRLFVRTPLAEGRGLELDLAQVHYLGNVLRLEQGDQLLLFDGESGEWLARIVEAAKKKMIVAIERRTRETETIPDLWLAFAPVKRAQTDWLAEKATELGIARLVPVITQRTIVDRVNLDRLEAIAIEAAEQCGRTVLPQLDAPVKLAQLLHDRSPSRTLYVMDEAGGEPPRAAFQPGPALILTGPEGGFTDHERETIRAALNTHPISLGPRILRAETAALSAITTWMALAGDWR